MDFLGTFLLAVIGGLRGLGHQHLARPEGLKGLTFGPASEARQVTGTFVARS
jgi:hypothetical protein